GPQHHRPRARARHRPGASQRRHQADVWPPSDLPPTGLPVAAGAVLPGHGRGAGDAPAPLPAPLAAGCL
ncbi:MAG: hypothetical protein AVDCRST_MAG77-1467, partial [uncultured Chloroflexi bacterium]